jgi:hypothetical protein
MRGRGQAGRGNEDEEIGRHAPGPFLLPQLPNIGQLADNAPPGATGC